MKKAQLVALSSLLAGALLSGNTFAEENKGWVWGPVFQKGFDPHFTVGVTTGRMDPDLAGAKSDTVNGLTLSLNCPWFQPPKGTIRQVFNYNVYDDGNYDIRTFELNPRYFVPISPSVQVGVGPGFGYMWVDAKNGTDDNMWTFQVGADLDYRHKNLFFGVATRYMVTQEKELGTTTTKQDANNWVVQLRAGFNF
jgi:hypothetical protein